mgnify:FL=1
MLYADLLDFQTGTDIRIRIRRIVIRIRIRYTTIRIRIVVPTINHTAYRKLHLFNYKGITFHLKTVLNNIFDGLTPVFILHYFT